MFQSRKERQNEMEIVTIEELVPEGHLLRKIDQYIDFSFIPEKVRPYYSEKNGQPSLDPLVLFKRPPAKAGGFGHKMSTTKVVLKTEVISNSGCLSKFNID
uniref:hypothetical protein n=1 Tax=Halobacillus shinanisalinarum TaxID=2932258 RepID=UPI0037C036EC